MRILALHTLGHDTGVSLFEDGRLIFSIETERLTREKHDYHVEIALRYLFEHVPVERSSIDLVAISTNIRNRIARIPDLPRAMTEIAAGALHYPTTCELLGQRTDCLIVSHEASHAALACHYAGYAAPSLILVNEGRGSFSRNALFSYSRGQLVLEDFDMLPWYGNGFGWSALGYLCGYGISPSVAGKVMALGGYGTYSEGLYEALSSIDERVHYRERAYQEQEVRKLLDYDGFGRDFQTTCDLVHTFQQLFNRSVQQLLEKKLLECSAQHVALGGGCALNVVLNSSLRHTLTRDIAIAPACNDAGQALGAGIYAQKFYLGIEPEPFSVYSNGMAESVESVASAVARSGLGHKPYEPSEVASRLAEGAVVAFVQGRAELGPRALGHRSLLANPSTPGMRRRLSEAIKEREWFRPLAPVMRVERFCELFPGEYPSPHMLFSYDVPAGSSMIEAMHIDGTARIQTLFAGDNPQLHELLRHFENQTGVPALINTSLNGCNKAIAYSVQDVLDDYQGTDVDLFVFQDTLVSNRGEASSAGSGGN